MRCIRVFAAALLFSGHAFAQPDIQIQGNFKQTIEPTPTRHTQSHAMTQSIQKPESVTLLRVELSDHAKEALTERFNKIQLKPNRLLTAKTPSELPSQVQLGMNHVPVLEQGDHGSCAMFANSAAVDAALNRGDYISQLCQLELGQYLEQFGYNPSGWDGSIGPIVLNQMQAFGIVSKATQQASGCGGLTDYPTHDELPEANMTLADYHQLSEPLSDEALAWSPVLDIYQMFLDKADSEKTLLGVKHALNNRDRLTIGVLLFGPQYGVAGAVGKHHTTNDTWVLAPEMLEMLLSWSIFGAHAMIITGYDDHAIAIDNDGNEHRGLLTLRNSWGERQGDHGNFYMSYDYFKTLAFEVQRIRSLNPFISE